MQKDIQQLGLPTSRDIQNVGYLQVEEYSCHIQVNEMHLGSQPILASAGFLCKPGNWATWRCCLAAHQLTLQGGHFRC